MILRYFYLKLLMLTLFTAAVIGVFSLLLLNRLANQVHFSGRQQVIEKIAEAADTEIASGKAPEELSFEEMIDGLIRSGAMFPRPPQASSGARFFLPGLSPGRPPPRDTLPPPMGERPPPPPEFVEGSGEGFPKGAPRGHRRGPPRPQLKLWLFDEARAVLSSSSNLGLPDFCLPQSDASDNYSISSEVDFFRIGDGYHTVRLKSSGPLFLCVEEKGLPLNVAMVGTQLLLIFLVVIASFLASMIFSIWYLRSKSVEARQVIGRLEKGDLKARFQVNKMDQFGGLMTDFNRMASEIEKLVQRVRKTEQTRKNLLQELAHDIRTPLTSLSSSFETLQLGKGRLAAADESLLFDMGSAEIEYMKNLFENMVLISTLEEPGYTGGSELVDVLGVLSQEVDSRKVIQASGSNGRSIDLKIDVSSGLKFQGDLLQIQRLFRNLIDNGLRHAKSKLLIKVVEENKGVLISIIDDGEGFSESDLQAFGRRRERRQVFSEQGKRISLGLGSVIASTIVGLHGGKMEARNLLGGKGMILGAEISLWLPKLD